MAADVSIGVWGAGGRLGSRIVQLAASTDGVRVARAWVRAGSAKVGQAVPGLDVRYSADGEGMAECDVVIDVSLAPAALAHIQAAGAGGKALLMAATGLDAQAKQALSDASSQISVCQAPNLSTGVWVLAHLVRQAARALPGFDIEVSETHHRLKKDAPSGTALLLAEHAAQGREVKLPEVMEAARTTSHGARVAGSIGMVSLRGGDVVGDHTVFLYGDGERLELTHRAHSRDTFARGALTLAMKLAGRPAGLISVPELLGLGAG